MRALTELQELCKLQLARQLTDAERLRQTNLLHELEKGGWYAEIKATFFGGCETPAKIDLYINRCDTFYA